MPTNFLSAIELSTLSSTLSIWKSLCFCSYTKFKKTGAKTKLLNGVTLNDKEIVYATDYRLEEEKFRSDIIGAEKKAKKEEFKYANFVSDFQKYFDYALAVSKKAIEEIEEGYIAPKPLENECKFCPYKSVCKFDGLGERKKKGAF